MTQVEPERFQFTSSDGLSIACVKWSGRHSVRGVVQITGHHQGHPPDRVCQRNLGRVDLWTFWAFGIEGPVLGCGDGFPFGSSDCGPWLVMYPAALILL